MYKFKNKLKNPKAITLIALVITTGIVMIINYIVNKLWVFKEK